MLAIVATLAVAALIVFPRVQAAKLAEHLAEQHNWSLEERNCRLTTNNLDPEKLCKMNGQVFTAAAPGATQVPDAGTRAFTTVEEDQGGF